MKLCILTPAYNEEIILPEFIDRTTKICIQLIKENKIDSYEVIIVDDGSTDQTWNTIKLHSSANKAIKGIKLSRNFGHQNAIKAAIDNTECDIMVFLDSDLQGRPEDIAILIDKIYEGSDVVWGLAGERHDGWMVKTTSKLFYSILNKISKVKNPQGFIMIAIKKNVLNCIKQFNEINRFNHGLWASTGFKSSEIKLVKDSRKAGKSKLRFLKRLSFAITIFVGFSKIPLRISIYLGFATSFISICFGLYYLLRFFINAITPENISVIIITFFFGILFIILGILGEYIGIIMDEVKKRPEYFIEEKT